MSNTLKSWINAYFSQSGFIALQQEQARLKSWTDALKQIYTVSGWLLLTLYVGLREFIAIHIQGNVKIMSLEYCLTHVSQPDLIAGPKPLLTEFTVHQCLQIGPAFCRF